jgi:hypothetical protein
MYGATARAAARQLNALSPNSLRSAGDGLEPAGGVVGDRRAEAADGAAVRVGLVQQAAAGVEGGGEGAGATAFRNPL